MTLWHGHIQLSPFVIVHNNKEASKQHERERERKGGTGERIRKQEASI